MNICIEGNMGSGKTTLVKLLGNVFPKNQCTIMLEPIDEWSSFKDSSGESLFDLYYKDQKRYAYIFQKIALRTRTQIFLRTIKENNYKYGFFDRSIFSDCNCFAENCYDIGSMNQIEWRDYIEFFDWLNQEFQISKKINGFIYLKTSPEVAYQRLKQRNRTEELEVPLEYLKKIHNKHDQLMNKLMQTHRILVLDGDCDFENNRDIQQKYILQISKFLKNL